ncbi:hypothetical protein D6C77_09976 [Aureobasidium pullulans]|nr:hypothetical protein D6C77_09976 [Aureobasidium pullulans]
MHHTFALLLVAILATVALAAPTAKQATAQTLSKRSFTIPRIRKTGYVRKPSEAMGRAYRKFGWSRTTPDGSPWIAVSKTPTTTSYDADTSSSDTTSDVSDESYTAPKTHASAKVKTFLAATLSWGVSAPATSSAAPAAEEEDDETGEVIATPADNGAEYLSPVTVGGQQLNLNFDTGSSDLWVFSTSLTSAQIGEHSAYNSSKSSTYQELDGYTFSLSYGDGSGAAGIVGTDTVDIGGATVTRQAIELATSVSSAFVSDADSDGLVGLAFSTLNSVSPRPQKTFFDNIMSELAQPVFTAALDLDGSGTYEFGTIDASKFTGNLMFTPVNASSGFWQFDSNSYSVGGKTVTRSNATPAIADTGTSLLLLDPEVVQAYYAQVPSAVYDSTTGGYVYDCSEDLPEFAVAVGDNYMANIPGSGITFAPVSSKTCFGGIQSNSGSDLQIFGDVLLKHHFVVFHGESELLGMAAKADKAHKSAEDRNEQLLGAGQHTAGYLNIDQRHPYDSFVRSMEPQQQQPPQSRPGAGAPAAQESTNATAKATTAKSRPRHRRKEKDETASGTAEDDSNKRRCVSSACVACRKRKSKCDGNTPACAACSQVYGTECIYDPNSDHRRKGVYRSDADSIKTRNSTLQTLIHAILNYPEEDVPDLVHEMRTCESLDKVAERVVAREQGLDLDDSDDQQEDQHIPNSTHTSSSSTATPQFEKQLSTRVGELRLDDGSVRYIGGTSNLLFMQSDKESQASSVSDAYPQQENPVTSWTNQTSDPELVMHLVNMYFTWHYTFFTCLPKHLFHRDFMRGRPPPDTRRKTEYCTPLLVNAILALGCHFTSLPGARENPEDSATAGDHFFREAKRLIMDNDEYERPKMTTVQALALMSVREAGCGREAKGWVYSGMSFRMACDMGLNIDSSGLAHGTDRAIDSEEEDARRITFWGCFLFDKCWSNYLGRLPQLPSSAITVPKFDVFPGEDSASWAPYTDSGFMSARAQPARTRTVALQISVLCEISNDLMRHFYNPSDMDKSRGRQAELKMLSDIHTRLETWRRNLPAEMEPKEGGLSSVLTMHMFFQLLFIHLFRPFLKYNQSTSPLPANVSPRRLCTQAAAMISKLMRLYKRSHGLRQICNVTVYIMHSACTIHLLNLPDKNARRDIIHGIKHLEEIGEGWLGARRTLSILSVMARKWKVELPEEAATVLARADAKFGAHSTDTPSPMARRESIMTMMGASEAQPAQRAQQPMSQPRAAWTPAQQAMLANSSAPMYGQVPFNAAQSAASPFSLPPQSASDLRATNYPSSQSTPFTNGLQPINSAESPAGTYTAAASPSDMFGGVEQLLRESQDWVFRDQAQLASGFGNWGGLDMGVASLGQSPVNTGPTLGAYPSGAGYASVIGSVGIGGQQQQHQQSQQQQQDGFETMTSYDEREWYQ